MKHGPAIVNFLYENQATVRAINMQGDSDSPGFLKITLKDGSEKIFDGWDEEDQGLFACALQGESWDPSKRGIPSDLTIHAPSSERLTIVNDRKLEVEINEKPLDQWGEPEPVKSTGQPVTFWKKELVAENSVKSASQPSTFCEMKKGFLG